MIELIYPVLDQFEVTWYRYQNLRAQAIESGFAVDFGMLINLTDGDGKKYPLNDILQMWKQTGILPFMSSRLGNYQGGAVTPVSALPNNLLAGIQGIQADFALQFQLLEQITGINPVALGQSPNPEAPVSTTQAALQSTINVLKPVATASREIKENIAVNLMAMIQAGIKADGGIEKSYALVVGDSILGYIKEAEKDGAQYGIKMEAKPDQLFKQNIAEYIKIALQNGRDGKAGMDIPQAMLMDERLLRGEDITQLRHDITFFIEKSKRELARREERNIMLQNQQLQQLEQMKQQGEAQLTRGKAMVAQAGEAEKRKTERMVQNYQFIDKLLETAQREKQNGEFNSKTMARLDLALKAAGYMDLSQVDLPSEVARLEGSQPQMPNLPTMGAGEQMPQMAPSNFPQMAAPDQNAIL